MFFLQPLEHDESRIHSVRVHPEFSARTYDHDFAVVELVFNPFLEERMRMSRRKEEELQIEPICIDVDGKMAGGGGGGEGIEAELMIKK